MPPEHGDDGLPATARDPALDTGTGIDDPVAPRRPGPRPGTFPEEADGLACCSNSVSANNGFVDAVRRFAAGGCTIVRIVRAAARRRSHAARCIDAARAGEFLALMAGVPTTASPAPIVTSDAVEKHIRADPAQARASRWTPPSTTASPPCSPICATARTPGTAPGTSVRSGSTGRSGVGAMASSVARRDPASRKEPDHDTRHDHDARPRP